MSAFGQRRVCARHLACRMLFSHAGAQSAGLPKGWQRSAAGDVAAGEFVRLPGNAEGVDQAWIDAASAPRYLAEFLRDRDTCERVQSGSRHLQELDPQMNAETQPEYVGMRARSVTAWAV